MIPEKTVRTTTGIHAETGTSFHGYEIHIGQTNGPGRDRPFAHISGGPEGASSSDDCVSGTYLHGIFSADAFRAAYLQQFGVPASQQSYGATVEATLDELADHLEAHLDVEGLLALAR